ncbi:MAG: hypothetical protein KIT87_24580 [Anaerolineae bacterium]|nr:hypothetical protein [Anaerolineae bacterium]
MTQNKPKARGRKPGKRLTAFKTALVALSMGLTVGTWGILTSPSVQAMQAVVDDGGGQVAITAPASPTAALATPISQVTATVPATATTQPTTTATATVSATATAQPTATATASKQTAAPAAVARTRSSK